MKTYAQRVRELEREGASTSDAQAVADAELAAGKLKPGKQDRFARFFLRKNPSYDDRELMAFRRQMEETEKLPLAERKANAVEWYNDLLNDHMMVAQRVGWLLNGSYGKGSFDSACRVLASPRMNQVAWCAITIANLEWRCPAKMAIMAWKKLPVEKRYLVNEAIRQEIADAKREGYCGEIKKNGLKRYYAEGVKVGKQNATEKEFFYHGKYIGRVEKIRNWGSDVLARPINGANKFFTNLRDASDWLVQNMV